MTDQPAIVKTQVGTAMFTESELPEGQVQAGIRTARDHSLVSVPGMSAGIYENQAGVVRTESTAEETLFVLAGTATIELDTGQLVSVGPGDLAYVPKGHVVTWTFDDVFRIIYVISSGGSSEQ